MKLQHFLTYRILSCLLALLALTSSCQDDLPPQDAQQVVLTIQCHTQGFSSNTTRTIDVDYTTNFTKGDEIGIVGVKNGAVMSEYCNLKVTYDGEDWIPENDVEILLEDDITYMAYSPYKADLNTSNLTSITKITKQFSVPSEGQADRATYQAADLLISKKGFITGQILTFNFSHAFSMLEVVLPRTVYKMDNTSGNAELTNYYIRSATYKSITGKTMFEATPNGYRCLITPGEGVTLNGEYTDENGQDRVFTYTLPANTIQAGECRCVVVDNGEKASSFKCQHGDFFLSNGTIVSRDSTMTEAQKAMCIGVIYYLDSKSDAAEEGVKETLNSMGIGSHGYVVALKDAWNISTGEVYINRKWGSKEVDIPEIENSTTIYSHIGDNSGMTNTAAMEKYKNDIDSPLYQAVEDFRTAVPAPANTTGWFIPTVGQWMDMIEKFGQTKVVASDFTRFDWSTDGLSFYHSNDATAISNIRAILNNIPCDYDTIESKVFWSSSEFSITDIGTISFEWNWILFAVYESGKEEGYKALYTRCFLGF
jgi:hypothetical protein